MGWFKKLGQQLGAPFDRRGPHNFDRNGNCTYCGGNAGQLGNVHNCSSNRKW